jgi:REP element-mobilizing transposase RayT
MPAENENSARWTPAKNIGLMELIRAKRQWHWKPSIAEQRKGFRGWHQRGYLPHFDAPQVTQFITFQLFDAFPIKSREGIEAILKESDDSKKRRKLEAWLDRGQGECHLRRRDVAETVESILRKDHGKMYQLQAWVIMPNHVHLVVDVWEVPLVKLINGWKGIAARAGNKLLGLSGPFWQKDYYDTLIRNEAHLKQAIRYTEQNPVKACLAKAPREWLWSSAKFRDDFERLTCRLI